MKRTGIVIRREGTTLLSWTWLIGYSAGISILSLGCAGPSEVEPTTIKSMNKGLVTAQAAPQHALCEYAVYSTRQSQVRDRAKVRGGLVGSSGDRVELSADSKVFGGIESMHNVDLRSRAYVDGDVLAGGDITQQDGVVVTGDTWDHTAVTPMTIPTQSFTCASGWRVVENGHTWAPAPGSYPNVAIRAGGKLVLGAGTYTFSSLRFESGSGSSYATLDVNVGTQALNLRTCGELYFGNFMRVNMLGASEARRLKFYSNTTNQVVIGTDIHFYGVVTAPYADVHAYSRTGMQAALYGREVWIEPDSQIDGIGCCSGCARSYTLDADFDEGQLFNVNHDIVHDQLQLNDPGALKPFPFVNVAASNRGTMVRIDANTGAILGEYKTAPATVDYPSPSRTTVDRLGRVWVANREDNADGKGSVTRIGLVFTGVKIPGVGYTGSLATPLQHSCEDRNGDGIIQTSLGLGDIRPWAAAPASAAEDECIINYTRTDSTGDRTIAVDANNEVWVGGFYNRVHEKLDANGNIIPATMFTAPTGGYGGLLDCHNVLWSAGLGPLLRVETSPFNPPGTALPDRGNYGLGMDPRNGHIWHVTFGGDNSLYELDATGDILNSYTPTPPMDPYYWRGVAVDGQGHVWVAGSGNGKIWHLAPDLSGHHSVGYISLDPSSTPTGVAVDNNGKIWATLLNTSQVVRIDPNAGPLVGSDHLGAVDLTVELNDGATKTANPYNYSDMTGFVLIAASTPSGYWSVIHDSCATATPWSKVSWNSLEPAGSHIGVEVRAADTRTGLSIKPWIATTNGGALGSLAGRYIETRATFQRTTSFPGRKDCDPNDPTLVSKPVLYDLTIQCGQSGATSSTQCN